MAFLVFLVRKLRPYSNLVHLFNMSGFSDIQLPDAVAKGVLRGDRGALADAYRLLARAVINMATRILNDRQLAEEVVQDTFIDLVEKASQIQNADAIVAWVRRVAVNHCLMRLRSPWHARRSDADADDLFERGSEDRAMEWVASVPNLEAALATLSDEGRTVVWLHDVEGYTHKEIGEAMGKTASFSKSQLARAYERLLDWHTRKQDMQLAREQARQQDKGVEGQHAKTTLGNIGSPCTS